MGEIDDPLSDGEPKRLLDDDRPALDGDEFERIGLWVGVDRLDLAGLGDERAHGFLRLDSDRPVAACFIKRGSRRQASVRSSPVRPCPGSLGRPRAASRLRLTLNLQSP